MAHIFYFYVFFFKQKTAYEMRISDWSSDVCSSDLPDVHGILLQHPVSEHINERACFDAIALEKDVDGVTCLGYGRMAMGQAAYGCATPLGIMRLLQHYEIPISGRPAVVVGRSPILGKPMAAMSSEEPTTELQ